MIEKELYQELLIQLLSREHIQVTFTNLHISAKDLIEATAYQALCEIKRILEDESLEDRDCFLKIEEIIRLFDTNHQLKCATHILIAIP